LTGGSAPLSGVTVLAVEHAVAGPFGSRQLADLGARVIKVERPGTGDFARDYDHAVRGMASHFVWLNRGKESVEVDVKTPLGAEVLRRLIDRADVVMNNLSPAAAQRLGIDAETLRARRPELIVCAINGYGSSGPYAGRRSYDMLVQGEAGVIAITGDGDHRAKAGIPVGDIAGGATAANAVLAALVGRGVTGQGASLEISLLTALTEWMGYPLTAADATGRQQERSGLSHPAVCPYDAYPTSDGPDVLISVQNDAEWVRLATDVLGRPDLAHHPDYATNVSRCANRAQVDAAVAATTSKLTGEETARLLDEAGVANGRVNDLADVLNHPQLRDRWREHPTPVGPVRGLRPVGADPSWELRPGAVPALGEHTGKVLAELGFSADQIAELTAK
jgi:crotonobetainyl-CoA:carnitine CoA-transferase CaiB-like acyl-CoA transferase